MSRRRSVMSHESVSPIASSISLENNLDPPVVVLQDYLT